MNATSTPETSSETPSAMQLLVERFLDFPDFRRHNDNHCHLLVNVLVCSICAILGGCNSWLAVERFVLCHSDWFRTFLTLDSVPSHDTFRRIFQFLDSDELDRRFSTWMADICDQLSLKQVAIDGKTMCGSGGGRTGLPALHLVHAFAVDNGICVAQQEVEGKSNEIKAIPELLRILDLKRALVTIDAMGCQKEIAKQIVNAEGDYVLAVKGNQEHLHEDVCQEMQKATANRGEIENEMQTETREQNRGRYETRKCYTSRNLEGIRDRQLWWGLRTIGMVICERVVGDKVERETRYFISSRELTAKELLASVRCHWQVENGLHWVLDVVYGEDGHQLRVGNGARNFTTLRKLTHALIKNSKPKHGIKGTREMAGWNTDILEDIIRKAPSPA